MTGSPAPLRNSTENFSPQAGPARGLALALDFAETSHRHALALLVVVALAMFVPGFFQIPPVDRDEARFTQATKQMIETGDYVDIRFQEQVRYKKPVGIYWLQASVVKTADAIVGPAALTTIWLYRIPSLIGAVGAVLLTYWTALAFVSRRAAVLAGMMMAASVLLGIEARLAKTDAMLLLTTLAAMGAMARIYLTVRGSPGAVIGWRLPALFWTAMAGGVLLKGPLIFLVVGLTAMAVSIADRSARWLLALRPLTGMLWCMVLVLPWFASILYRSGNAFLTESLGRDMLAKMTSGQEAHGAPPGYYLLLFWVTFWPGAVLAGLAAPMAWRTRREPAVQFLLAWLIPSWIVFELVVTKLPHYVLPLYPSIAILMAAALERGGLVHARWLARGTIGWFLFPAVLAIVNVVAFIYFTHNPGIVVWPFGAAAAVMGLFAWWLYDADGPERAILRAMVSAWLIAIMTYGITLPSLPALFPSVIVADMLREAKCERPQVAAAGYHEPSLVFLSGTQTRLVDGAGAAEFLRQGPCRFALVDARSERSFVQRAEAIGLRYRPLPPVDGYNVSNGRAVSMSVFQSNDRR